MFESQESSQFGLSIKYVKGEPCVKKPEKVVGAKL